VTLRLLIVDCGDITIVASQPASVDTTQATVSALQCVLVVKFIAAANTY